MDRKVCAKCGGKAVSRVLRQVCTIRERYDSEGEVDDWDIEEYGEPIDESAIYFCDGGHSWEAPA